MNEQSISQMLDAKDFKAPRITPAHIDSVIASAHYFTATDGVVGAMMHTPDYPRVKVALSLQTFCVLTLKNGFTVTGESACASPENFDAEIGRKIAYKNAYEKIWVLEGYLLKERLYEQSQLALEQRTANSDPAKIKR